MLPAESRGTVPTDAVSLARVRENVSEAIRILLLRRWHFLVPFCVGTMLAATATHYLPRTYTATTTFDRVDDDVIRNLPIRVPGGSFLSFRETLRRDVTSPEIMNEVVDRLGLSKDFRRNPDGSLTAEGQRMRRQIGGRLASGVSARFQGKTPHQDTVHLYYEGPDGDLAAPLLNVVREAYVRRTRERLTRRLQENKTYFENEAARRRKIIDALDSKSVQREIDSPIIDPTNPNMIFITLTSLKNEERELKRKRETVESKLLKTKQYVESIVTTASPPPNSGAALEFGPIMKSPRIRSIEAEIARIDTEIEELKIKRQMTDKHPEIVERRELRRRYKRLLVDELGPFATVPNLGVAVEGVTAPGEPVGEAWRAAKLRAEMDIVAYEDELEQISGALRKVEADIQDLERVCDNIPAARRAHREVQEELSQARNDYKIYAGKAQQFATLLAADEDERGLHFVEVRPAVAPSKPKEPKPKSVLVLALLIGTGAGVLSVLLAELFDRSFHTSKQVAQSLGLNILETIDEIVTSVDRARRFRRRFILAPAVTAVLLGAVCVTMSMAYLHLQRPHTYERLMQRPRHAWSRVADSFADATRRQHDMTASGFTEVASTARPE